MKLAWDGQPGRIFTVWACPFARLTETPQPWTQVADAIPSVEPATTWDGAEPDTAYRVGVYVVNPMEMQIVEHWTERDMDEVRRMV